ncbi:MAG TPA: hypothetical protein VF109_06620 [Mycobacteriales bacterium]
MTNPGPPDDADSPPTGPGTRMGLPESGTQHATSTDFALPVDEPVRPGDPFSDDLTTPPAARPAAPLYDEPAAPLYDEVAAETGAADTVAVPTEDLAAVGDTGGAVYGEVGDASTPDAGPLGAVKAFAAQRPALFLGAVLAAGYLIGRLLSSSDDGVES